MISASRFSIPDLHTGNDFLARIPVTVPRQAADQLLVFLDALLNAAPDTNSKVCFQLLENAQPIVATTIQELSRSYLGKALPLSDIEEAVFQKLVSLLLKISQAYAQCLQPDNQDLQQTATILHRCIFYSGQSVFEHLRARREYPDGLWARLNGYYASAEKLEIETLPLTTTPDIALMQDPHCQAAYISVLLCDMASCYGMSARDQNLVRRWASLLAPLVMLLSITPEEAIKGQFVDLTQDRAMHLSTYCPPSGRFRRLDTVQLAAQIIHTRELLRQRIPPSDLGLGSDCSAGQCAALLEQLTNPWCQMKNIRKFRRRAAAGTAHVCSGFEEMYFQLAGKPFEQPENVRTYSRQEFETLFAFRFQDDPQQALQIQKNLLFSDLDAWAVLNESPTGFLLKRNGTGRKITYNQIIALRPYDSSQFLLVCVAWLMQGKEGELTAGVEALPGVPQPVAARVVDQEPDQDNKYHPAFILSATPPGNRPSLVLPVGRYRPKRIVELSTDKLQQVRMTRVISDGPDFEHVDFECC